MENVNLEEGGGLKVLEGANRNIGEHFHHFKDKRFQLCFVGRVQFGESTLYNERVHHTQQEEEGVRVGRGREEGVEEGVEERPTRSKRASEGRLGIVI